MEQQSQPVCIKELEEIAQTIMPGPAWDYYDSGANGEQTKRDNEAAFAQYRLHPKMLRDVSSISTETVILGQKMATPLGVSPCAMHKLAHKDGELATARAVAKHGGIMILSTFSSTPMEKVISQGNDNTQFWLQLYVFRNRKVSEALVRRAEAAGFKAIVLTVDAPELGRRLVDARNKFSPPPHVRLGNFADSDAADAFPGVVRATTGEFSGTFSANTDRSLSWGNSIGWLKSITSLPIIIKGVLTADDTRMAISHGCAGVFVSNHGGRQLDGTLAAIDALPQVVEAAGNRVEIYVDGGVRQGTDVFKALALGARAVFVARPVLWGLAYNGESGAFLALDLLRKELELAMTLIGTVSIAEINESYVYQPANRWVRYERERNGTARRLVAKL